MDGYIHKSRYELCVSSVDNAQNKVEELIEKFNLDRHDIIVLKVEAIDGSIIKHLKKYYLEEKKAPLDTSPS